MSALTRLALAGAALLLATSSTLGEETCVTCHGELKGALHKPVTECAGGVHARHGFSCTACHGGDGAASAASVAHASSAQFVGRPRGLAVLQVCGRCHSDPAFMKRFDPSIRVDQVELYRGSHHGKRLLKGDQGVATCTSCHGSHGILPPSDRRSPVFAMNIVDTCGKCHANPKVMKGRDIPTDVVEKYKHSVHGQALLERGDLGAPACNSCHGNHGATPPQVTSVANVCGTCHAQQAALFRASSKREIFDMNGLPECVFCHSNHAIKHPVDAMLDCGPTSPCSQCHDEPTDKGYVDGKRMAVAFARLELDIAAAAEVLGRAERAGMEVSSPQFELSGARDRLTQARVLIHGFKAKPVLDGIEKGEAIAKAARRAGEQALVELDYRRRGLYVSLGAIALLALALWLKIRDVDRRHPPLEGDD